LFTHVDRSLSNVAGRRWSDPMQTDVAPSETLVFVESPSVCLWINSDAREIE
jgi:hypothetical protein